MDSSAAYEVWKTLPNASHNIQQFCLVAIAHAGPEGARELGKLSDFLGQQAYTSGARGVRAGLLAGINPN